MGKSPTWVRSGSSLLLVMLLVPLHGPVIAKHHFPQCLAQVSQAGDVAVCGDMLRQGGKETADGETKKERKREKDRER